MKPFVTLGETKTPNGSRFALGEHDGEFFLKLNGTQLMSTTSTVSELLLADLACDFREHRESPRVLIGGLGLGFSLKRVLEIVGPRATVVVAELWPEVVAWNQEFLKHINGHLLEDKRVEIFVGDVYECIAKAGKLKYDAILLDVDNGPTSFVQPQNSRLYGKGGFSLIRQALHRSGNVAFWSAEREPIFKARFAREGFQVQEVPCKAHERAKRMAHYIYVGEKVDGTVKGAAPQAQKTAASKGGKASSGKSARPFRPRPPAPR